MRILHSMRTRTEIINYRANATVLPLLKIAPYTPERAYNTRLLIRVTGRVRIGRVQMDRDRAKIIERPRD